MAIEREVLNEVQPAAEVQTGVYSSYDARNVVVVKVAKDGMAHYLSTTDCTVKLECHGRERFLRDYPRRLPNYPAMRAIRKFADWVRSGSYTCEDPARKVLNAILAR